jgi:hypothetical protein
MRRRGGLSLSIRIVEHSRKFFVLALAAVKFQGTHIPHVALLKISVYLAFYDQGDRIVAKLAITSPREKAFDFIAYLGMR